MTTEIESSLDRNCFYLASLCAEPFCKAFELLRYRLVMSLNPTKFDHYPTVMQDVAYRSSIVAGAVFFTYVGLSMPMVTLLGVGVVGIASKAFRAIGCYLQKEGYTHVSGKVLEKPVGVDLKVMTWNILGLCGGMHYDHGGVVAWPLRLDRIVQQIKSEDPDVLVLQEIYDGALGEALIAQLGDNYAHFYTHLGPNVWGTEGGVMVVTKCAVEKFQSISFETNDWTMNRTFAILDLGNVRIVGTHLMHGKDDDVRVRQLNQIKKVLDPLPPKPTLLVGDLNREYNSTFPFQLTHGYRADQPTCTNRLNSHWTGRYEEEETIDYISLLEGSKAHLEECHLVRAFEESTQTALSDHHGLVLTIKGFE